MRQSLTVLTGNDGRATDEAQELVDDERQEGDRRDGKQGLHGHEGAPSPLMDALHPPRFSHSGDFGSSASDATAAGSLRGES